MKKQGMLIMAAAVIVICAAAFWFIQSRSPSEGSLEKEGLEAVLDKVKETEEFPKNNIVDYLGADINKKGQVTDFTLTLSGFDSQNQYVSNVGYTYDSETGKLECREYKETAVPTYYDANSAFTYVDSQIRRIPFEAQIRQLDFERYRLEYQPDTQIPAGMPVMDGRNGQDFPVLTYEEYQQGQGGVSDGSSAMVISLNDGTGATGKRLEYYCEAADEEALAGHPETVMQMDYQIRQDSLLLTADAGETWIDTGLTPEQVNETRQTYQLGGRLFEDSWYGDQNGIYGVFYGKTPVLRLSKDGGATWTDVPFSDEMPRLCTRRIIRFLDSQNGYAGLGTDWSMGTGGSTFLYWTHDGGATWTRSDALEESGMMLDGLAFADQSDGVASLQSVNGEEAFPALRVTDDGGATFTELALPWESLPADLTFLDKVDGLTMENGTFTLILGQGTAGNQKAVFTSTDVKGGWTFQKAYRGTVHTEG